MYHWTGKDELYDHAGILVNRTRHRTVEGNRTSYNALSVIRKGTDNAYAWGCIIGRIHVKRVF